MRGMIANRTRTCAKRFQVWIIRNLREFEARKLIRDADQEPREIPGLLLAAKRACSSAALEVVAAFGPFLPQDITGKSLAPDDN
jgi:hypothetical protein